MDLIKVVQYDQKQVSWFSLQMDKGGNFYKETVVLHWWESITGLLSIIN